VTRRGCDIYALDNVQSPVGLVQILDLNNVFSGHWCVAFVAMPCTRPDFLGFGNA
jgi:hypothetical protein